MAGIQLEPLETRSETYHSYTREEDTRTCLTEPDRVEHVEEWLTEKQTCTLNPR